MTLLHKNCIANLFKSEEQLANEQIQKIENERQERERLKCIAITLARLMDAIPAAHASFAAICANVDKACINPSPTEYANNIIRGVPLRSLAEEMAAHEALKANAQAIKIELEKIIVGIAGKNLADFKRANAADIKKLPKLKKMAEAEFIPAQPEEIYARPAHVTTDAVRRMFNLAPGETLPPSPFEIVNDSPKSN